MSDVVKKNMLAIKEHAEQSRKISRDSISRVEILEKQILDLRLKLEQQGNQIQMLLVKTYSGGATS